MNPETGSYLELDIYLPSMRLAFEFQERHHYATVAHSDRLLDVQRERDALKKELATAKKITLITVPCWWDGTLARYSIFPSILCKGRSFSWIGGGE